MTAKRVRDFALYILIGLAIAVGGVWYGYATVGSDRGWVSKWLGLTIITLILFGYTIKEHKRFISRLSFWLVFLALLVVHLSIFTTILLNVGEWKVVWFVLAYPLENFAIDEALALTGHDHLVQDRRRSPSPQLRHDISAGDEEEPPVADDRRG